MDEAHPNIGSDPYALSKEVDEATLLTMHRRHGYQAIALDVAKAKNKTVLLTSAGSADFTGKACTATSPVW